MASSNCIFHSFKWHSKEKNKKTRQKKDLYILLNKQNTMRGINVGYLGGIHWNFLYFFKSESSYYKTQVWHNPIGLLVSPSHLSCAVSLQTQIRQNYPGQGVENWLSFWYRWNSFDTIKAPQSHRSNHPILTSQGSSGFKQPCWSRTSSSSAV